MTSALVAALGAGVLLTVPGLLVLLLVRPRVSRVGFAALVPPASLTAIFVVAEVCLVTGVPFGPVSVLVALAVLASVTAWRSRRDARPVVAETDTADLRLAHALLLLGIAASCLTWALLFRGVPDVPPNADGANHGFFVARIVDSESIDPKEILVDDVYTESRSVKFYPFALHAVAALDHRLTGADIARTLMVSTVALVAVALPLGLFALVRRLLPERPFVAGASALLVATLGYFPFRVLPWGGLALLAGIAITPVCVLALLDAVRRDRARADLAIAAVMAAAVFATHQSEVATIAVLLTPVLIGLLLARRLDLGDVVRNFGIVAVGAAVLVLPLLVQFVGGAGERTLVDNLPALDLTDEAATLLLLRFSGNDAQPVLAALTFLGIGVALWRRELIAWLVAGAAFAVLWIFAVTELGDLHRPLTFAWYRAAERVAYHLVFFVPVFAALAMDAGAAFLARFARRPSLAPLLVVGLVGAVVMVPGARLITESRRHIAYVSPVGEGERAAFEYLADHVEPGERVATQFDFDGSLWMYALGGVAPLFGVGPVEGHDTTTSWDERALLIYNLGLVGSDPDFTELADRYQVRYVYIDDTGFGHIPPIFTSAGLAASPNMRLVFEHGDAYVFEIVRAPA